MSKGKISPNFYQIKHRLAPLFCLVLAWLLLLGSCSGYHAHNAKNPFFYYGIKSVSVPEFINKSIYPSIAGPLSKSIFLTLSDYPDLIVYSGEDKRADAILVGIIHSPDHRASAYDETVGRKFIADGTALKSSIGSRPGFYVNNQTTYKVTLRLMLIKDPTWAELSISKTEMAPKMVSSKVIFNEEVTLQGAFSRVLDSNLSPDDGGVTNFTKTKGVFDQSLESVGQSAGDWFKGLVINAF